VGVGAAVRVRLDGGHGTVDPRPAGGVGPVDVRGGHEKLVIGRALSGR
jgi:hypothetical protein